MKVMRSSRAQTIASLAVVLFCFFRSQQYIVSLREAPALPACVCELIEPALPCYDFPLWNDGVSDTDETTSDTSPPRLDHAQFEVLELEFSHSVFLRLRVGRPTGREHYSLSWLATTYHRLSSDEIPARFFS